MALASELKTRAEPQREAGQINYEGFASSLGWERDGYVLPPWEMLPGREQDAWRAGAHDVMQRGWLDGQEPPAGRHAKH